MSFTKLFIIVMALDEIPVSGCTCRKDVSIVIRRLYNIKYHDEKPNIYLLQDFVDVNGVTLLPLLRTFFLKKTKFESNMFKVYSTKFLPFHQTC
jgi:hypothetical protein